MSEEGSISRWLEGMKAGEAGDIERLWDSYFHRLVRLAAARLPGHARREYDEEDVALSAFHSFCARAGRGQFSKVNDRNDLWHVLATITARKAITRIRYQTRQKRGGGQVVGESGVMGPGDLDGMEQFLSKEPAPEEAVEFSEDLERMLETLGDPTLRIIAWRKLDGCTSEQIAGELGISARSVDRKLELIRKIWSEMPG